MKKTIIIAFLFISVAVNATNYYVKKTGNNSNNGLTDKQAWATIAKVNASSFSAGDTIFFKRGDEWREQLRINQSGTASARITFTAYGVGPKPIINGADVITGWGDTYNNINANIWGTIDPSDNPGFALVVIDDSLYEQVATLAELTSARKYWIKGTSTPDSIYLWSKTNPDIRVAELSKRANCIRSHNHNYITISYLELKNAGAFGLYFSGSIHDGYCVVDSVFAYRNRCSGIEFGATDFTHNLATNCVCTYNGNGIVAWTGADNTTVSHCYTAHGVHNWIDGPAGTNSDGAGVEFDRADNCIVEYCESAFDHTGIYLDPEGSSKTMTARYNYVHDSPLDANGSGYAGIGFGQFTGGACYIYYNLLVNAGNNETASIHYNGLQLVGMIYIYNNTIYSDATKHIHSLITLSYGANVILKNNIYYEKLADATNGIHLIELRHTSTPTVISNHNQYYKEALQSDISYLSTKYTNLTNWRPIISQDLDSQDGDPLFINNASDWKLQADSPCINKGVDVGLTQDILGNPIIGLPDLGAFESQIGSKDPTPLYLSSIIQNVTPSRLEMFYSLNLANIVPIASTFTVQVNSVARTVNSVSTSGTKVILTLASAIVFGDVVTVAYTKAFTNPLQSTSGKSIANITSQPVTNNCLNKKKSKINIYPNPAHDFVNISVEDSTLAPEIIKIINLSGKIVFTDRMEEGRKNVQILGNLNNGIYIITLESGNLILYADKLIISK